MTLNRALSILAAGVFGFSLLLFPVSSALSLTEAKPPADLPALKPLTGPKSMKKAREELLTFLYNQLKHSDSEESADRIVGAIA